jgi:DNA-binding IclR family transcriptional regulator
MLRYNDETHCYSVGLRLVEMAHKAWQQSSLAPIAAPILVNLSKEVEETVHLAQMETGQVLFVDKYRTSDRFETLAQAGRVAPAHCTGVGKAILAFLSERRFNVAMSRQSFNSFTPMTHLNAETLMKELKKIRLDGIAYDREEHEQGIISIAAPILTTKKRVIGAISIATTTNRHNLESIKKFKPILMESTKSIGEAATAWQFPQTQ